MAIASVQPNPIARMLDTCIARHCPQEGSWVVSVTGSGGKTTTIEQLALYWAAQGMSVLVTTTTKMAHPERHRYPFGHYHLVSGGDDRLPPPTAKTITLYGMEKGEKIVPVEDSLLRNAIGRFDRILIEADGARGLPLKIHAQRDPVIPAFSHVVLALVGLGATDHRLDDRVMYLPQRYRQLTKDQSEEVSEKTYRTLVEHPEGILKGCIDLPVVICCNQCDVVGPGRTGSIVRAMLGNREECPFSLVAFSWHEGTVMYDGIDRGLLAPERSIG